MEILTYPGLKPIDWTNPPKATTRVATDEIATDGVRFTGSFRTACHMAHLMDLSVKEWGFEFHIIQPPYHTGVDLSSGTHNLDACSDLYPPHGVTHATFQRWLRGLGFDNWWRHTGPWTPPSQWHNHGFTHPAHGIKFAAKVGVLVDGGISTVGHLVTSSQITDHVNHAFGLANAHTPGSDTSWFPPDQHAVAFNLASYVKSRAPQRMPRRKVGHSPKGQPEYKGDSYRGIQDAVARGCVAIDLNVRMTKDKKLGVQHWPKPLRHGFFDPDGTLDKNVLFGDLKWVEAARLETKDKPSYKINLAVDLFNAAIHNDLDVEGELKERVPAALLKALLGKVHHPDRVLFKALARPSVRSWEWLREAKEAQPDGTTLLLCHRPFIRVPREAQAYIDRYRGFKPRWV